MRRCRADAAGLWGVREPDQARQMEVALRDGPDLAGMAFVAAAPPAPPAAQAPSASAPAPDDSMLLLRLGFLGDVAVSSVSMPWSVGQRQRAAAPDEAAAVAPSLGALLGPRHTGTVPEYVMRRPAAEVRLTAHVSVKSRARQIH